MVEKNEKPPTEKATNSGEAAAVWVDIGELKAWENNPRKNDQAVDGIVKSIKAFGFGAPILARASNREVIAGHTRLKAAAKLDIKRVPVRYLDLDAEQAHLLALADNRLGENAEWDDEMLGAVLADLKAQGAELDLTGFDEKELEALMGDELPEEPSGNASLSERFGFAPFSVLDARRGEWRQRKHEWEAMGLSSGLGRGEELLKFSDSEIFEGEHGTSIFDPVLCELGYRWFSAPGGKVLDPFAGGSVRGIVAATLGREYVGVDVSRKQVEANRAQWDAIQKRGSAAPVAPKWIEADSRDIDVLAETADADLILSCPPYAYLEKYSDDPRDLSTLEYEDFREAYFEIIDKAVARLKPNRFALFVVGEVRSKKGQYVGFVPDTIRAFEQAGASFHNEAILVTPLGSVRMRTATPFENTRKFGKTHQNVLVFVKGDAKKAAAACGAVDTSGFEKAAEAFDGGGALGDEL